MRSMWELFVQLWVSEREDSEEFWFELGGLLSTFCINASFFISSKEIRLFGFTSRHFCRKIWN